MNSTTGIPSIRFITDFNFVFSIFIIIFSTLSNFFCYHICCKERLSKIHVFVFYKYLLVSNILSTYFSNIYLALYDYGKPTFLESNVFLCAFYTMCQFFSYQWLSWQIVSLMNKYFKIYLNKIALF